MAKKLFSDADFDKSISIGDELVFDKQDLKTLRIDLSWVGTDLDICAFLLGDDGLIHDNLDGKLSRTFLMSRLIHLKER